MTKPHDIVLCTDNHPEYMVSLVMNIVNKSVRQELRFNLFISDKIEFDNYHCILTREQIVYKVFSISEDTLLNLNINSKQYKWITNGALYRLLSAEFLDEDVKWFLYLDTDLYVNTDIREIFNYIDESYPLVVANCKDGFNSGVMLINRQEYVNLLPFKDAALIYESNNFDSDNELLVHVFKSLAKSFSLEYNFPILFYVISYDYLGRRLNGPLTRIGRYQLNNVKIFHYLGPFKPWQWNIPLPYAIEWRNNFQKYFYAIKPNFGTKIKFKFLYFLIYYKCRMILKELLEYTNLISFIKSVRDKLKG